MPPFLLRKLAPADLSAMAAVQSSCELAVAAGYLQPRTAADLAHAVAHPRGGSWGAYAGDRLVGFGMVRAGAPAGGGPPMPRIPAHAWPQDVAWLEGTVVHPDARGHGLQRRLLAIRLQAAADAGLDWAAAGTHAGNGASRRNLLAAGFAMVGMLRLPARAVCGYVRPTRQPLPVAGADHWVDGGDLDAHERLLGEGLVAVGEAGGLLRFRRWTGAADEVSRAVAGADPA